MTTYSAIATTADEASASALADAMEAMGPSGVGVFEIEDGSGRWEVGGYFLAAPDGASLALLSAAFGATEFIVSAIPDRDWLSEVRRGLTPVEAGRFIVYGGHDRARIPVNAIGLEIEAAMAFGTGHHGTTEGCLLLIDRLARRGLRPRRVADVGCGTGVLAMAALRRWPCAGWAGDVDPVAVATARANFSANGVASRVQSAVAPGLRHPRLRAGAPYDLILANILARPLKRLAPEIAGASAPGGVVVLSGLLTRQEADVTATYRAWGLRPIDRVERRGWASLALRA